MLVAALLLADRSILALATADTWMDLTLAAQFAQASSDPLPFPAHLLQLPLFSHHLLLILPTHPQLLAHQAHQVLQALLDLTEVLALPAPLVLKAQQDPKAQLVQAPLSSAQLPPFLLPCLLY